ncbi:ribonuclease Y [Mesoplasma syrphidae]|uniref:Ribonuclease Y n=1 Tax=Mesoplasma syrphidae TaxID=225999 RepID=A0A2K9C2F1_9MOLU|nr:ribonuclease Y [Mesoplasma syrphidae]AUF83659.1 ribonuclease Y [Mesoplasma syrphidae]
MVQIIIIAILTIAIIGAASLIIWMLVSKSRKHQIEKAIKVAKIERKQILGSAYREINDIKLAFEKEKEFEFLEIANEKTRIKNQLSAIEKDRERLELKEKRLELKENDLEKRAKEYDKRISEIISLLEQISEMSKEEAKALLLKKVEQKSSKELSTFIKNAELVAHSRAKAISDQIIIGAMEKYTTNVVNEKTSNIVKLPSDEMKGRVIGKDGRNIKAFEQYGGVDILVDETPGVVTISSFNPIRREIATRTLEKLIADGRIQPVKIESEIEKQRLELEDIIIETGYQTIRELNISNMDIELVKLIGRLKYRTSYGQSVLMHSLEVAKIAGAIAAELKLNIKEAIRAGLLHDIGKAVDFEEEGSHVLLGVKIAKKYGESEIVINAIESHHEDVPKNSEIAAIVSIADSISASRPGARNNTISEFISRMTEIEKIGNDIPGVNQTYALQSGRQIRVIVDPMQVSDAELYQIVEKVKEGVLKAVIVPGEITITVIREKREIYIIK